MISPRFTHLRTIPFFTGVFLSGSACWAAGQTGAAITAFDEAEQLLEAGKVPEACAKFETSYSLDPQLGVLIHLADCRELAGQFASAWTAYRNAAELAETRGDERASFAQEHAAALATRISKVTVEPPKSWPAQAHVFLDDRELQRSALGTPMPMDGGSYRLRFEGPGYETFETRVQVENEGDDVHLELPALKASQAAASAGAEAADAGGKTWLEVKWPALVAYGLGIAGGAVWAGFGIPSLEAKAAADQQCGASAAYCEINGEDQRRKAYELGQFATVGMIATGAGLALGTVLLIALPAPTKATQSNAQSPSNYAIGVQPSGVTLHGTF
jgi:hypothetical protein